MSDPLLRPAGDRGVLVELAENRQVHAVAAHLRAELGDRIRDVVPGHRSVLVTWTAAGLPAGELDRLVREGMSHGYEPRASECTTIGVSYGGLDLDEVADRLDMSPGELVAIHTAPTYVVGFVGFAAGFAYLLGGDPRLRLPRRAQPRQRVPAGAVAIAGPYTACYPRCGPGGWNLLGRTDAQLFDPERDPPALLRPGAAVRLEAIGV